MEDSAMIRKSLIGSAFAAIAAIVAPAATANAQYLPIVVNDDYKPPKLMPLRPSFGHGQQSCVVNTTTCQNIRPPLWMPDSNGASSYSNRNQLEYMVRPAPLRIP